MVVKAKRNNWGDCVYDHEAVIDILYNDPTFDISTIYITEAEQYNSTLSKLGLPYKSLQSPPERKGGMLEHDKKHYSNWHMPEKYKNMNLKEYLLNKCSDDVEKQRVNDEYKLFEQKNFLNVLKFLVFFTETLRENDIVWGVGRGSSVSSFCLFLIGVHKINPLLYNLDYREFLR